jgi:hypothetical protein
MVVGCATKPTVGEAQWRTQLERQQQGVREAGRIGYIGYEGQAPEGSGHWNCSAKQKATTGRTARSFCRQLRPVRQV